MTMNEKERLTLQNFHTRLVKDIIPSETFLGEFIQEGILDFDLKEEILSETTDSAKNAKFLSILLRRGPKAFPVFLQVLERTSPWIKEDLETFYNKQKRIHYTGDIDSIFASSPDAQPQNEDTSPKRLCIASTDIAIQTDDAVEEDGGEVLTLNNIYLRLVTYLHSQGHKDFDIVADALEPDLLNRVISEILKNLSTKDYKLTQIMDMFNDNEKEMAQNEVCTLVGNVISEKESLKTYRDNKDLEVMRLEEDYNATIEQLQSQIRDLEGDMEEEHNQVIQLEEQLSEQKSVMQRMEEAEEQRQQEPLLKRMHNLIEEVTQAKSQKEKQMYETGQEYQDLMEETKCIEDLLYQLKDVHDYHVTQNGRNGVRQSTRRQIFRNVCNGVTYNRIAAQRSSSNEGFFGVGISTSTNENVQMSSRLNRSPRRRLKRSPRPQYRLGQRNNTDNAPLSPKQKTPRYQQPTMSKQFAEMQVENRPATRQSTNLSRCVSRQGTDLSFQSMSRQSTAYQTSRQNSSVARPTSSRQSQISLDLSLSARNRQTSFVRNGTKWNETASPLPSARQTPCESPQVLFNTTYGAGANGIGRKNFQSKDLCSMR